MEKYIGDNKVTLKLAGLRYIAKADHTYSTSEKYELRWEYKGQLDHIYYEEKEARDAMYDRVKEALTVQ